MATLGNILLRGKRPVTLSLPADKMLPLRRPLEIAQTSIPDPGGKREPLEFRLAIGLRQIKGKWLSDPGTPLFARQPISYLEMGLKDSVRAEGNVSRARNIVKLPFVKDLTGRRMPLMTYGITDRGGLGQDHTEPVSQAGVLRCRKKRCAEYSCLRRLKLLIGARRFGPSITARRTPTRPPSPTLARSRRLYRQ
jgi:hypothetical protein